MNRWGPWAVRKKGNALRLVRGRPRHPWLEMIRDTLFVFSATLFAFLIVLLFLSNYSGTFDPFVELLTRSIFPIHPRLFAILYVIGAASVIKMFVVFGPRLTRSQKIRNYAVWSVIFLSLVSVAFLTREKGALFDVDCSDFDTEAEAQRFFEENGPGDPHFLDADGDGRACEALD